MRRMQTVSVFLWTVVIVSFAGFTDSARGEKSPYDWALVRLDYAKKEKVRQLNKFCNRLHELAQTASMDDVVLASFDINLQYAEACKTGQVPGALQHRIDELRKGFVRYYIEQYITFYDVLFVSEEGDVFYSIRSDLKTRSNLIHDDPQGDTARVALQKCLSGKPQSEVFLDFRYYAVSSEPAAFFVEPVRIDGHLKGWVLLQCAINKVNTIMSWTEDIGQTGETFLVNLDGYMLTESNFEGASTILQKRLDDRNVQAKFAEKHGNRTVIDYRGCSALTSFEVVEFLDTPWLVVAKMDVDEIITQHYLQHRRYYADRILDALQGKEQPPYRTIRPEVGRDALRIDMDEFQRAEKGQRLHTFGVSTCTGLIALYPDKFAYLAHISPKDRVYDSDGTNLLGQMIKRINSFDIYRYQRRDVVFVIIATHKNSMVAIIDKLVDEGFLLSQIRILYNPEALSSAIMCDSGVGSVTASWKMPSGVGENCVHTREDAVEVADVVERIMQIERQCNNSNGNIAFDVHDDT